MKMSSACSFVFKQIKVIFIRMVSHLDSLSNRGTRELGNCLKLPNAMTAKLYALTEFYWPSDSKRKRASYLEILEDFRLVILNRAIFADVLIFFVKIFPQQFTTLRREGIILDTISLHFSKIQYPVHEIFAWLFWYNIQGEIVFKSSQFFGRH